MCLLTIGLYVPQVAGTPDEFGGSCFLVKIEDQTNRDQYGQYEFNPVRDIGCHCRDYCQPMKKDDGGNEEP